MAHARPLTPFPLTRAQAQALRHRTSVREEDREAVDRLLHLDVAGTISAGMLFPKHRTLLMLAVHHGWDELVDWLLPASDPNARDEEGNTALMLAALADDLPCVQRLWPVSNLSLTDQHGRTALMLATFNGGRVQPGPLIPWLMAQPGLDLERRDFDGHNVLHMAILNGPAEHLVPILNAVPASMLREMVPMKDGGFGDANGLTPLMLAVTQNQPSTAEILVPWSDPLQANGRGISAWSMAMGRPILSNRMLDAMALQVPHEVALEALAQRGPENLPRFHRAYEQHQLREALSDVAMDHEAVLKVRVRL